MADVEQIKKIVPVVTCEITFGQNVCELMLVSMYRIFGVNVSNLNFKIKINPVKQPIQSNTVGSWYLSHGTPAFYYHLNHNFIVLKDIQHSIRTRMCHAWWNVINNGQIEVSVHGWTLFPHVWLCLPTNKFLRICWSGLVRNETLCVTPENAQNSSWCWFWVFEISRTIRVLRQCQPVLLCCVSHVTILSVFICVMNVWDQSRHTFFTCFCPSHDRTSKFVHRPTNTSKIQAFENNLWANFFWQVSNWSNFFFLKMMVIHAWCIDFEKLLSRFICKFAVSFHAFLCMTLHFMGPRRYGVSTNTLRCTTKHSQLETFSPTVLQ